MTENPKKKPLTSDDESSIPSELDIPVEKNEDLNPKLTGKTIADISPVHTSDILPPSSDASSSSTGKSSSTGSKSSDSSSSSTGSKSSDSSSSSTGSKSSDSSSSSTGSKSSDSSSSVPSTSTGIEDYDLEENYKDLDCNDENFFTGDCNKFLLKKELAERNYLSDNEDDNEYLYPNLNDK